MIKQEKLIKVLQIWQELLDRSFSLLYQAEHSLNDTDSQKYNKESMKGLCFSDSRAVRNTLSSFSD